MASVFTPGLKVNERTVVSKVRKLPLLGEVLVRQGEKVSADTLVARTEIPGKVFPVNVASELSCAPREVPQLMRMQEGEPVQKGEVIAESSGLLGFFRTEAVSPIDGYIDSISRMSGQVMIRERPMTVTVDAYIDGEVTEVVEHEGAVISSRATFVQGIFGIGGEVKGELKVIADRPSDVLDEYSIDYRSRGKVIVGGSLLTRYGLERAIEQRVTGIVVGGINFSDISYFIGRDLGVGVTGTEQLGLTIVVTEGFGKIDMAQQTFDIMCKNVGKRASINGATQIRAGVVRPEVIIPLTMELPEDREPSADGGIRVGSRVRAIRYPYFGRLGIVTELPEDLMNMPSETKVRVLKVKFDDGESAYIPRANVEAISSG